MATAINDSSTVTTATVINFANKVKGQNNVELARQKKSGPAIVKFFKWLIEL